MKVILTGPNATTSLCNLYSVPNHIPVFLNFLGTVYILHKGSIYEIRVVKVHLNIERKITLHGVTLGNSTS